MEALNDRRKIAAHPVTIIFIQTDLICNFLNDNERPAALTWEQEVVACNQLSRSFGVFERMPVSTASKMCPELSLINAGETLLDLKTRVEQVSRILLKYSPRLERIGLDECYLDLSKHDLMISSKERQNEPQFGRAGHCSCGCHDRLSIARRLATQIQNALRSEINVNSRIGISYSKTMARIAADRSPVGDCSVGLPEEAALILPSAPSHYIVPDIVVPQLLQKGIHTVKHVRDMNFETLKVIVGRDCAVRIKNAAIGMESESVVPCDRWQRFSVECEIREKYRNLLLRLLSLSEEQRRTPLSIKVSVRKFDPSKNSNFKEAKTGQIPFGFAPPLGRATPEIIAKILTIIMSLFHRIVNVSHPFHLSLLGLAFVRFEERGTARSVASCLLKKRDLSIQAIVSISCEGEMSYSHCHSRDATPEPSDSCEEAGPSEKKAKIDIVIKKRKLREEMELCSPSKLRVSELSINCDDVAISKNGHNLIHC